MSSSIVYASSRRGIPHIANTIHAIRFIRRMRGGSQASLIRCNDGKLYVVKFSNNQQGPNVLANEVIGSQLLRTLGFPTPSWKQVFVSNDFIDQNPDTAFEAPSGKISVESGLHFGSEFLGDDGSRRTYEWLPGGFISRLNNPNDYLGIYILDVLANHCDARQSLFTTLDGGNSFQGIFIDHGHLFGGPNWDLPSKSGKALCQDLRLYSRQWTPDAIEHWISYFETKLQSILPKIPQTVPGFWYSGNISKVIDSLRFRLGILRILFSEELALVRETRKQLPVNFDNAELSLCCPELPQYGNIEKGQSSRLAYGI
jgi:hypothetical protein